MLSDEEVAISNKVRLRTTSNGRLTWPDRPLSLQRSPSWRVVGIIKTYCDSEFTCTSRLSPTSSRADTGNLSVYQSPLTDCRIHA